MLRKEVKVQNGKCRKGGRLEAVDGRNSFGLKSGDSVSSFDIQIAYSRNKDDLVRLFYAKRGQCAVFLARK